MCRFLVIPMPIRWIMMNCYGWRIWARIQCVSANLNLKWLCDGCWMGMSRSNFGAETKWAIEISTIQKTVILELTFTFIKTISIAVLKQLIKTGAAITLGAIEFKATR